MSVVKIRNNGTNIRFFAKYKVVDSEVFGRTCFCLGLLKRKKTYRQLIRTASSGKRKPRACYIALGFAQIPITVYHW